MPYRAHIKALVLKNMLDLGCGIGRNLAHNDGRGVGIDHNAVSVQVANSRGLTAFLPEEFEQSHYATQIFDNILCAHVAEHVDRAAFIVFCKRFITQLASGGRFVLITPQKRGYASDPTHVRYVDFSEQRKLFEDMELIVERKYSFPLPLLAGGLFTYNEFVTIARKP